MDELTIKARYVFNAILITIFDYEKYYSNLLKNALKYGMSRSDFWYGEDYKDYFLYEEAYYERLHETSHIQGYYNYIALNTIVGNVLKKKSDKAIEYPRMNILSSAKENTLETAKNNVKQEITKENLEEMYRKRLSKCF